MPLADLQAEAATLILRSFDETTALTLGLILMDLAKADAMPIVINIRTTNRTLFHLALPGSSPNNDQWARRKSNTALLFSEASFLVGTRHREKGETLARHGLDPANYSDNGGAVPLRVAGVGTVAVATVSGLPQADDHALVVRGIKALIARI